jgi:hypothetical protein
MEGRTFDTPVGLVFWLLDSIMILGLYKMIF